ncbi:hypothetical protein [Streptomyces sp. bgisy027]|uniref:hypothetical protein n=1 Tax=Streptomyces sp. bgisy027 TaxID=3413770 RepID=UPI003D7102D8
MPGTSDERDFSGLEGGELSSAVDHIRAVVTWYSTQIVAERRAPLPDEEKIARWTEERKSAHADLQRLETADAGETARLAGIYATRRRELGA